MTDNWNLDWEYVQSTRADDPQVYRARITSGWLVRVRNNYGWSVTFVPHTGSDHA